MVWLELLPVREFDWTVMLQPLQGDLQESPDSGGCKLGELADALDVEHGSVDVRVRVASIAQEQEIAEELEVMGQGGGQSQRFGSF